MLAGQAQIEGFLAPAEKTSYLWQAICLDWYSCSRDAINQIKLSESCSKIRENLLRQKRNAYSEIYGKMYSCLFAFQTQFVSGSACQCLHRKSVQSQAYQGGEQWTRVPLHHPVLLAELLTLTRTHSLERQSAPVKHFRKIRIQMMEFCHDLTFCPLWVGNWNLKRVCLSRGSAPKAVFSSKTTLSASWMSGLSLETQCCERANWAQMCSNARSEMAHVPGVGPPKVGQILFHFKPVKIAAYDRSYARFTQPTFRLNVTSSSSQEKEVGWAGGGGELARWVGSGKGCKITDIFVHWKLLVLSRLLHLHLPRPQTKGKPKYKSKIFFSLKSAASAVYQQSLLTLLFSRSPNGETAPESWTTSAVQSRGVLFSSRSWDFAEKGEERTWPLQ